MMPFLSTLCLLGVVLVGLLLMTSAISLEQAGAVLARGFIAVILILLATCLVERLVAIVLAAMSVAIHWIVIAALVIAGLITLTAVSVWFTRRWPKNRKGDDL